MKISDLFKNLELPTPKKLIAISYAVLAAVLWAQSLPVVQENDYLKYGILIAGFVFKFITELCAKNPD